MRSEEVKITNAQALLKMQIADIEQKIKIHGEKRRGKSSLSNAEFNTLKALLKVQHQFQVEDDDLSRQKILMSA